MTLEQRKNIALDHHRHGYNCAQSVALAYSDLMAPEESVVANATQALGGGIGAMGETCGVVTGMAVAVGLIERASVADKPKVYKAMKELGNGFKAVNDGRVLCRELKRPGASKSCDALIAEGVELLYKRYFPAD